MRTPIYFRRGNKVDLPVLNAGEPGFAVDTKELYIGASGGNVALPNKTYANLTYYVDTALGNDANDGLAAGAGRALKTIQAAINKIPQIVNHTVTVNVAAGTYAEAPTTQGFVGTGSITINGGTSLATAANFTVQSLTVVQCGIFITINGFTLSAGQSVNVARCIRVDLQWIVATVAGGNGVSSTSSLVNVSNSTFSNKSYGILADLMSTIYSAANGGTGNTNGLGAGAASTIGKSGSQPAGTTAELVSGGGVIR